MKSNIVLSILISLILLYALGSASGSGSELTQYFWWIIASCLLLIAFLLFNLVRYLRRLQRDMLGSRLARRLIITFTLVAFLPALFLFTVAAQFISFSINSWFGNNTSVALERSLQLSKSALDLSLNQSVQRAKKLQQQLTVHQQPQSAVQSDFAQIVLYRTPTHQLVWQHNPQYLPIPKYTLTSSQTEQADIENIGGTLYANIWLTMPSAPEYAVFFRQAIPKNVAQDAELIEAARSKYAELHYVQQSLQTFFLITLLVATLLAVTLAAVIALYFSRRFLEPILSLSEAAKAVARGDFQQKCPVHRNDELGKLTDLFNHMIEQLDIAQTADIQHRLSLEAARHYLETVLESLTTGVITLDKQGKLNTYNHSACHILNTDLSTLTDHNLLEQEIHDEHHQLIAQWIKQVFTTRETLTPIQATYSNSQDAKILLAKAVPLPEDNGSGTVIVFDDITALIRAQKEAAWSEVARRLAHEIRNPLTPIQLAAERLAWKLQDKLSESDAQILQRSTATIVHQVDAMKEMVEAFRNYARTPVLRLEHTQLNHLIEEVVLLYEGSSCRFTTQLADGIPSMQADKMALRQVLHNLFKNAQEAAEYAQKQAQTPCVQIQTQFNDEYIMLTVCNNGKGFSESMLLQAFEPYITDKATGTGLGLPVVKKIIDEHGGTIKISNQEQGGACVRITFPFNKGA